MTLIRETVAVPVDAGAVSLVGDLSLPGVADAVVAFAHGSGSSRSSPRNRYVAGVLNDIGLGTLLIDLLTASEEVLDSRTAELRFDIGLLALRFVGCVDWLATHPDTAGLAIGAFGASTGAAAALCAAAERPSLVSAVVSRGGRPDLAADMLGRVRAPTLLLVGARDPQVLSLNQDALARLNCTAEIVVVPGATHLFEESGTLEAVADHAGRWFRRFLTASRDQR
jgi:pimeloyl-ACP methyl ester carboxylesterase